MCFYNIITQTQSQTRTLSRRPRCKERLEDFVSYIIGDSDSIILYRYLGPPLSPRWGDSLASSHDHRGLIFVSQGFFLFIHCVECIVDQIEQYSSKFLRDDIQFTNIIVEIC